MSDSLAARGLGHVPFDRKQMPTSQFADVRVYDKTTTLGRVIEAAHTVGNEYDELLRDSIDARAVSIIDQIRNLVAPT